MSSENDFNLNNKFLKRLDRQTQETIARCGVNRKTLDEVFDNTTLLLLGKFISQGVIDTMDFPISTGKEANVFRAVTPEGDYLCIKIYRTSTSTFKHITKYINGDPRFSHTTKNRRDIITEWARKEYKNLERLSRIDVNAPIPIKQVCNILLMEYIGTPERIALQLRDTPLDDVQSIYEKIISNIETMYLEAGLVHADLSEYNILIYEQQPYIIDVGQAVLLEHPNAHDFLKRDLQNITRYFKKEGADITDPREIYEGLTAKHKNPTP